MFFFAVSFYFMYSVWVKNIKIYLAINQLLTTSKKA